MTKNSPAKLINSLAKLEFNNSYVLDVLMKVAKCLGSTFGEHLLNFDVCVTDNSLGGVAFHWKFTKDSRNYRIIDISYDSTLLYSITFYAQLQSKQMPAREYMKQFLPMGIHSVEKLKSGEFLYRCDPISSKSHVFAATYRQMDLQTFRNLVITRMCKKKITDYFK